ncbi:VOC family protein [Nocardia uniformis]|uniref:VOC family protein n=1 Tax=Nocardia uniformis TaxID=53432 RepID=A0A849BPD7_9NOCA|nr:VOC family protein [Nocardia uniformis]NNH68572.1 VOC family protein [Nocardia uniformis]
MPIPCSSFDHVRLTVTDIDRSRAFYDTVFGWPIAWEIPADADEVTRERYWFLFGGIIYQMGDTLLGLRPVGKDDFHEDRVGLDHLAFSLATRAEIDAAATLLDELGIAHEGVKDLGPMYILEFRDPDNIALELVVRKA